ncbi:four helix bundle protein [Candidatus Microgenomates bacterium]|nr:four helix bundle protein [Candidatus Microgenomates bacterium]
MSNITHKINKGGYENLIVYHLGILLYGLNADFCKTHLPNMQDKRTVEQMIQAARSGKQNIVEGILANSTEGCLKLLGVARASWGELIEDYKDFLMINKLKIWLKDDRDTILIRQIKIEKVNEANKIKITNFLNTPERFANLLITLSYKESYMLSKLIAVFENKFIKEGGFRENLFKKRIDYRNQQNK